MPYSEIISGGNVTFTANSATVTTSGIVLATSGITEGDAIITAGGVWIIDTVNRAGTTMVLANNWTGINTTIPLQVLKMSPSRWSASQTSWFSREAFQRLLISANNSTIFRVRGTQNTAPTTNTEGDQWLVGASPTGTWASQANKIALWSNAQWNYLNPLNGDLAALPGQVFCFNGTGWTQLASSVTSGFMLGFLTNSDAGSARTALQLGNMALQTNTNVTILGGAISGISDISIADGGTGASTAAAARTNLGISATNTPFTPTGGIAASNVQSALAELDTEKVATTGNWTMSGTLAAAGFTIGGVAVTLQNRTLNVGTGITGGGDLTANRTFAFDTAWGDARYLTRTSPALTANLNLNVDGGRLNINRPSGGAQNSLGIDFQNNGSSQAQLLYNFSTDNFTLNKNLAVTGSFSSTQPIRVPVYVKGALPSTATFQAGSIIYVSDDLQGATLAFSDGSVWRRVHDRAQVA